MSTKAEIVDCGTSYCKVFSTIFCRMSFSTATPDFNSYPPSRPSSAQQISAREFPMRHSPAVANTEQLPE